MKKFVSIFLAGMMLLTVALTGCGQEQVPEEPEVVQPKTIHVYTCDSDVQRSTRFPGTMELLRRRRCA